MPSYNAFKEKSKLLEDTTKEQIDKMEIELKVNTTQIREMVYARRENESHICDLAKVKNSKTN